MADKDIKVGLDTTEGQIAAAQLAGTLDKLVEKNGLVNQSMVTSVMNFNKTISYITRGFNLASQLLNENAKQTAYYQVAEMTAAVMNTAVTTTNLELQAISSFAAGNWLQGGFLQGMAVMSTINQSRAIVAKYQAIQNQNYINSVSNQIDTYS